MNAVIIAFAMYSKLPMPKADWTKENMKYAMCYFPWIGIVIGIFYVFIYSVWSFLPAGDCLRSVLLCLLPIFITGGIHLDGYIDTVDARHSYKTKEEKLDILKDPHVGAFAVIWTVVYFLLNYGFCSELSLQSIWIVAVGFVYSRSLSGLGVVTLKAARKDGLLVSFASTAETKKVRVVMYSYIVICFAAMLAINIVIGALCGITGILIYLWYKRMAYREFDGITGDLAGYFLQCCELGILIVAVIGARVYEQMVNYLS